MPASGGTKFQSKYSCALRREVVPKPPSDPAQCRPPAAPGDQLTLTALGGDGEDQDDTRPPARNRWAWLLAHIFRADLDTCPRCGGPMRWSRLRLAHPPSPGSWPNTVLVLDLRAPHLDPFPLSSS